MTVTFTGNMNIRQPHLGHDTASAALRGALEALPTAVLLLSPQGLVSQCNAAARSLLGLEGDDWVSLPLLKGVEADSGGGSRIASLALADGRKLRLEAHRLADGGAMIVMSPQTDANGPADALHQAESQYRSLFDNAICGIYRDRLDGSPVRANKALAQLNGYETEEDYLAAVSTRPANWYVDPCRARQFHDLLQRQGGVQDLVSEVYRHRTRQTFWITENAWYVRDAAGNPIYVEGTIQDATERVHGMAVIERQANVDTLTGAASRFRFLNQLDAETRSMAAECVLFIVDLDRFKEVNDLLGHSAGDEVLRAVVTRLNNIAGSKTLVARLGGDEFALLSTGRHCHIDADVMASRIVKSLRQPIEIEGQYANIGASVGVAVYPAHAGSAEELLINADLALYQAKSSGKNGFRIFDHDMKKRLDSRKALEAELSTAIAADELELYFQPIVAATDGAITGYEALMRWNHPRRGLLQPSQFIQVAEDAGLMTDLGNWAIHRACRQAMLMPDHLKVAVNVSPSQLHSPGIVKAVCDALAETGLAARRLTLEVTETAILTGEAIASHTMKDLVETGVELALDDFGTGYSSLSYVQRFAFSKVKIDRSFVAGIGTTSANLAIIRAIIRLARDLDIGVVAEGIETAEQAAILRNEGCGFLQGFLFGRPQPVAAVATDLATATARSIGPRALPPVEQSGRILLRA